MVNSFLHLFYLNKTVKITSSLSRPSIKKELRCEQQHIILAKPLDSKVLDEFRVHCVQVLMVGYIQTFLRIGVLGRLYCYLFIASY